MAERETLDLGDLQVAVLMGGFATRLGTIAQAVPKALLPVHGRPFFDYQLQLLRGFGFKKFLFLVGHHGEAIERYYGDGASRGISIRYSWDGSVPLGTGGALKKARPCLEPSFLLIYGDSFMRINYFRVVYEFLSGRAEGYKGLMTIFKNENRLDKSNVFYEEGTFFYDKKTPSPSMRYIDYGVNVLSRDCMEEMEGEDAFDLADLLAEMSKKGELKPLEVPNRFYEIGTPEALARFQAYAAETLDIPRKAVFLDRDGVINEIVYNDDTEQLDSPLRVEEFQYKDGAVEALHRISEKGYLLFVVTNQPAAAKGKASLSTLFAINEWMLRDLRGKGVAIEDVYMCPHHPVGNPRAVDRFLIGPCTCRKPQPGLIRRAGDTYHIVWEASYMVGDSCTDIEAGRGAGVRTVLIGDLKCDMCAKLMFQKPDIIVGSLLEFSKML